ncbi:unnamed protein product [Albugo candida]|nr:unnamed protein product [Albugo candida]|eukprot:CCI43324.1 unnamed protein product [Albugo candida]
MPLLIFNMGSEMLYIISARLEAQRIPSQKCVKVLEDLIRSMHKKQFRDELFQTRNVPNSFAVRQLFDRLVHSSIMRLNVSSMDKLYDLMRMGFKYQMLRCSSADELLQVTATHLDGIQRLVATADVCELITETKALMLQTYTPMRPASLFAIKQELCRFFQDVRIRVSLLLEKGLQKPDGSIAICLDRPDATGSLPAGTIQYFDDDEMKQDGFFMIPRHVGFYTPDQLGTNMYAKPKSDFDTSDKKVVTYDTLPSPKQYDTTALDGINLLASLIGAPIASPEMKPFRVSLFDDCKEEEKIESVPTVRIDAQSMSADYKQSTSEIARCFDAKAISDSKSTEMDDLISLMDSVSK